MMEASGRLVVFSGLPGTGKTTIAQGVAARLQACYLRIDVIEQAILGVAAGNKGVGPVGYLVAYHVALSNLQIGVPVVADAVNAVEEARMAWRTIAMQGGAEITEIELVCSDTTTHRHRVEQRSPDIIGHRLPDWEKVQSIVMQPWDRNHMVIDTAVLTVDEAITLILKALKT